MSSDVMHKGIESLKQGDLATAELLLSTCPEITTDVEACYLLGVARYAQDEVEAAITTWKAALRLDASHAETLFDLATAYVKIDNTAQAALIFTRLLSFHPEHSKGRFNFGNLLFRMGRTEDAIAVYAPLMSFPNPERGVMINLGRALRRAGRLEEADACYRRALIDNPQDHYAHWNRAHVLCLMGQWEEGFAAWEHRLQSSVTFPFQPDLPQWAECPAPPPKRLLLVGEQGHGDTVQCLRYLPPLLATGCALTLAIHSALLPFFSALLPESVTIVCLEDIPICEADAWAPLFSLPHRLGLPVPEHTQAPYLNDNFRSTIQSHYPRTNTSGTAPRIGVAWAGNPGHDNDHLRSMPGSLLLPLMEAFPLVQWQCLQFDDAASQLASRIEDGMLLAPPPVQSFADTAKIASSMDLIICVDTAIAHIAGTLGIPCWMMLAAEPDWRWGQQDGTTPWYPATRLFRQNKLGDWSSPLSAIAAALPDFLQSLHLGPGTNQ